jgi:hypothetical protein
MAREQCITLSTLGDCGWLSPVCMLCARRPPIPGKYPMEVLVLALTELACQFSIPCRRTPKKQCCLAVSSQTLAG